MDLLLRDSTSTASPLLDALSAKCDYYYGCETAHDVKTVVQAWVYIVIAVVVVGVAVGIIISACCFCKSCPLYKSMHKPAPPAPPAPRILTPVYVTQGNQYGGHVYHQGTLPQQPQGQPQPFVYYSNPPPYNPQGPKPAS